MLGVPRLHRRAARARPAGGRRRARRRAPPAARPRPGRRRAAGGAAAGRRSASRSTSPSPTRSTRPTPARRRRAPGGSTRCTTGCSSTRCCAARYPDRPARRHRQADLAGPAVERRRPRRRPGADQRRRSTCSGVNYYNGDAVSGRPHRDSCRLRPRTPSGRPARRSPAARTSTFPRRGLPVTDMGWEVQPEGLTRLLIRLRRGVRRPADVRHRERRGVRRRRRRPTARVARPGADRPTSTATCARCTPRSSGGVDVRGYFCVVAARQLRVGLRLRQAVRHRARRLRHPARVPRRPARCWYAEVAASGWRRTDGNVRLA